MSDKPIDPEAVVTIIGPEPGIAPAYMTYAQWLDMCKTYENEVERRHKGARIKTYHEILVELEEGYTPTECPRCHRMRYGIAQHGYCTDCAYTGPERDSSQDRFKIDWGERIRSA